MIHSSSHGIESKYFLLMSTGVMKVANHMITCVSARTNHKKATILYVDFLFQFVHTVVSVCYKVYLSWFILLVLGR